MSDAKPDPRLLRRELDFPDYVLDLQLRTVGCLRRAGIKTVGDLISKTPWDLLEIRGFGRVALDDVITELHKKNLYLKDEDGPTTQGENA